MQMAILTNAKILWRVKASYMACQGTALGRVGRCVIHPGGCESKVWLLNMNSYRRAEAIHSLAATLKIGSYQKIRLRRPDSHGLTAVVGPVYAAIGGSKVAKWLSSLLVDWEAPVIAKSGA